MKTVPQCLRPSNDCSGSQIVERYHPMVLLKLRIPKGFLLVDAFQHPNKAATLASDSPGLSASVAVLLLPILSGFVGVETLRALPRMVLGNVEMAVSTLANATDTHHCRLCLSMQAAIAQGTTSLNNNMGSSY